MARLSRRLRLHHLHLRGFSASKNLDNTMKQLPLSHSLQVHVETAKKRKSATAETFLPRRKTKREPPASKWYTQIYFPCCHGQSIYKYRKQHDFARVYSRGSCASSDSPAHVIIIRRKRYRYICVYICSYIAGSKNNSAKPDRATVSLSS